MRVVGRLGCVRFGDLQELAPQRVDQVEPDAAGARGLRVEEEEDREENENCSGPHPGVGPAKGERVCRVGVTTVGRS